VADVVKPDGLTHLEMRLILEAGNGRGGPTFRREALVNRRKVRLMDLLGQLRVVLFLPEDVELVTGAPAHRRRYLNVTLCQVDADYCRTLSLFNQVLEQRNALLRRIAEGRAGRGSADDLLSILTDKLVEPGARLLVRRAVFLDEMARQAQRIYYEELISGLETIRLGFQPGWEPAGRDPLAAERDTEWLLSHRDNPGPVAERLAAALAQSRAADLSRGATNLGPHRDDWRFLLDGKDLGEFGSRGQLRTAVLALKLAEINWMKAETSDVPLLLLDEVIAELDVRRRAALLAYVREQVQTQATAQALLTTTDPAMLTEEFLVAAHRMTVTSGRISRDAPFALSAG
jgi:DNA replication and repair protein RecF